MNCPQLALAKHPKMPRQSNIKYAIIAGGVALAIVAGVTAIGMPLNNTFTSVAGGVK
jgi:hypothetical protein